LNQVSETEPTFDTDIENTSSCYLCRQSRNKFL